VGRWAQLFHLLAGKDVDGDQVDLGVSVLACLGGRHVHDLSGPALDTDEPSFAQSRALHRIGERQPGITGVVKGVLMLSDWSAAFLMEVARATTNHRDIESSLQATIDTR
jgi:hypothetical protein